MFENVSFDAHLPFYYTKETLTISKAVTFLSYVTVALGWIALLMGFFLK